MFFFMFIFNSAKKGMHKFLLQKQSKGLKVRRALNFFFCVYVVYGKVETDYKVLGSGEGVNIQITSFYWFH